VKRRFDVEKLHEPKSEALRALFWRDEILQVMFWLHGEGFGEQISPELVERFLGVEAENAVGYLDRLVEEDLLIRTEGGLYVLTEAGRQHGARVFADEFADLTKPGHGECGAECWCHASPEEADACLEERLGHKH
jgi:hypothetical protein